VRRALTTLWRDDSSRTLSGLPDDLVAHTLGHFSQDTDVAAVRKVLGDEELRFAELLVRGRAVLSRRRSSDPISEEELRYLHDTHGLPRELVVELLPERSRP
jgi:alanyl-tRNA synthetase